MSDNKIVGFPQSEISPEEAVRRQMAEAQRLANLAPGEWLLWIDRSAERLNVPRTTLESMVKAIIKQREKATQEAKAEDRQREQGRRQGGRAQA